jgi:uncharacterized protein (TIGR03437 family)
MCLLLSALGAQAQNLCLLHLANQSDSATNGFILSLQSTPDSSGNCQLSAVTLGLDVGNGTNLHNLRVSFAWQTGVVYTAKAVIMAAGPQQLSLNGQSVGTLPTAFEPAQQTLLASLGADSGSVTDDYVVTQLSLAVSNGSTNFSYAPNGSSGPPLPLILMSGPTPWPVAFTVDPTQPVTVTATFRFDTAVANPHQFDPYIDAYGQNEFTTWPAKVATDADLQSAIPEEQTWLANNGPLGGLDIYGGSLLAGWTDKATGYYHTAFHNNRWFLISPLGNPLFYIGLDTLGVHASTPITGRASMFANLPPATGTFAPAYSQQNIPGVSQPVTYFDYAASNLIRKYGSSWQAAHAALLAQRLASWVFAGSGKWTSVQPGLALNPVLAHSAVGNVVPGGHPDVWDPTILKQLTATLTSQIGSDATNPYIVGWSVGNEANEIIVASEVTGILALGAGVPAKKALVDQALSAIYSGSVSALAAAWKITVTTVADVYASNPSPPSQDVEALRQFYEAAWYSTLYKTVLAIDPQHLYLGSWTQPKEHPTEWHLMSANCDVIGFDFYNQTFLDPNVQALIQNTKKPVLVGEFSYPADYGGMRGFGALAKDLTLTDSQSGDMYAQWLHDAAANPYVVGVEWFEYIDQSLAGNNNNNQDPSASPNLVLGQNQAFGMVDVANRPKYDLVNKVRAANIATLQSLGLLGSAPVLTSAPANGATYLAGGLVPGSWAQVKGTNLSDISRTWQNSDFVNLGNRLPTDLSGVQVLVNGTAAAVYYISSSQISFQVPAGITGTANVQVIRDGLLSNAMSAPAVSSAPGIFPVTVNGTNYAAGVFPDGKILGDPSVSSAFRKAKPGDALSLFATGLAPSAAGTAVGVTPLSGASVTIGNITVNADFVGLVAVGEFQINFTVPQQFANQPAGNYPITISINGVSSPSTINSNPPAPLVIPIQP